MTASARPPSVTSMPLGAKREPSLPTTKKGSTYKRQSQVTNRICLFGADRIALIGNGQGVFCGLIMVSDAGPHILQTWDQYQGRFRILMGMP